jgi:phosphoglycolate phosphatase-like HAD superfamily hydrolase
MKLFIWDFHGVLEKGNDNVVLEITNRALERHGYSRRMTEKESEFLSGRLWCDYFAYLIPELHENERLLLQSTCIEITQKVPEIFTKHVRLNDNVKYVLESIRSSQYTQILISNTQPKILDIYIELVGIEKYFQSMYRFGVDSSIHNRKTKKDCLYEFLGVNKNFNEIISIGDSPGDMELINIPFIKGTSYLYSYPNRPHRLAQCHYKIDDLRMVLQEIEVAEKENEDSKLSQFTQFLRT